MINKYTILSEALNIIQEIQNLEEEDPLSAGEKKKLFWQKASYPVRRVFSNKAVHPDDYEMNMLRQRRVNQGIAKERSRALTRQNPSVRRATNRQSNYWNKVLAASLEL